VTLALLFAGLTNAHAHVHLCFDGQEAPAAVHVADHGDHLLEHLQTEDHHDGEHDDIDLDVPNQALAKAVKHDLSALVPASSIVLLDTRMSAFVTSPAPAPLPRAPPPFIRPPLRAPPR
jgi:hypothetical protein